LSGQSGCARDVELDVVMASAQMTELGSDFWDRIPAWKIPEPLKVWLVSTIHDVALYCGSVTVPATNVQEADLPAWTKLDRRKSCEWSSSAKKTAVNLIQQ
jgi:hypothetical protein